MSTISCSNQAPRIAQYIRSANHHHSKHTFHCVCMVVVACTMSANVWALVAELPRNNRAIRIAMHVKCMLAWSSSFVHHFVVFGLVVVVDLSLMSTFSVFQPGAHQLGHVHWLGVWLQVPIRLSSTLFVEIKRVECANAALKTRTATHRPGKHNQVVRCFVYWLPS